MGLPLNEMLPLLLVIVVSALICVPSVTFVKSILSSVVIFPFRLTEPELKILREFKGVLLPT